MSRDTTNIIFNANMHFWALDLSSTNGSQVRTFEYLPTDKVLLCALRVHKTFLFGLKMLEMLFLSDMHYQMNAKIDFQKV